MRAIILLDEGFEDVEAIATRDVLLRGGVDARFIAARGELIPTSSHGLLTACDEKLREFREDFDCVILPGGKKGVDNLISNERVLSFVKEAYDNGKLVCAICAAPSILIKIGVLDNKNFTCFKGFEEGHKGNYLGTDVVVDGNVITAKSMYYSCDFGLAIVEKLMGKGAKEKAEKGMKSL